MDARTPDRPAFQLLGHAARVRLVHQGPGLLQISADFDPDYAEGTELTYLHCVAFDANTTAPEDLDVIVVPGGTWAVFRTSGPYPSALKTSAPRQPNSGCRSSAHKCGGEPAHS